MQKSGAQKLPSESCLAIVPRTASRECVNVGVRKKIYSGNFAAVAVIYVECPEAALALPMIRLRSQGAARTGRKRVAELALKIIVAISMGVHGALNERLNHGFTVGHACVCRPLPHPVGVPLGQKSLCGLSWW